MGLVLSAKNLSSLFVSGLPCRSLTNMTETQMDSEIHLVRISD